MSNWEGTVQREKHRIWRTQNSVSEIRAPEEKAKAGSGGMAKRCGGFPRRLYCSQSRKLPESWDLVVNFFHGCAGTVAKEKSFCTH